MLLSSEKMFVRFSTGEGRLRKYVSANVTVNEILPSLTVRFSKGLTKNPGKPLVRGGVQSSVLP